MESEALRRSLVVHRAAVDADAIDGKQMNNVLVFYGFGGVGKSALSVKLEEWVNGGVGCEHWGHSPTGFRVVTARWDLRDSRMLKNPVLFYLRLRHALAGAGVRTPLLDVGIVATAIKFNAGRGDDPDDLLSGIPRLAENLVQELFPGLDDTLDMAIYRLNSLGYMGNIITVNTLDQIIGLIAEYSHEEAILIGGNGQNVIIEIQERVKEISEKL